MDSRVEEEWVEEVGTAGESEVEKRGWEEDRLRGEVGTWLSEVEEVMGVEEEVVVVVDEARVAVTATAAAASAARWCHSRQAASLAWSRRRVAGPRCLGWRGSRTGWGCWGWG